MIIHVYAICWNEERMLPFFFKHYDHIADHYFIFDNGSTDASLPILRSHPRVTIDKFEVYGDSLVAAALGLFNQFWKQSRGKADWVIVCDIDEHLYHQNLRAYLQECASQGITLVAPSAYEMVSDFFPGQDKPLHESVRDGVRIPLYDKPLIFNPNAVQEINFTLGRHLAKPVGHIIQSPNKDVLLLHYKYLGYDYLNTRYSTLRQGLRSGDIEKGAGYQYLWNEQQKMDMFLHWKNRSVRVF
ncbi:glycosyltransferase family 2 protein [Paenibacillus montanisoli]|uniref:Glycosyltransferase family 2 protein n=1 Tax=Paenibacillus montanisoli TaxID=2081970 RepID=A0A328TWA3_9BACL|nr:glycosyltransferase family 2 protein [Paenibacillus montanisoli]RAP73351.1 glycosyltransferase family 2 protein [Paenibacillus montanisoli]